LYIQLNVFAAAYGADDAVFQKAQEFDLDIGVNFANFIQQQNAALGLRKNPFGVAVGRR
jgi:hypothetical protein